MRKFMKKIKFKKTNSKAVAPQRASYSAAGYDLTALIPINRESAISYERGIRIPPGESQMISTGIAVEIPEGYVGLLFGRSGLGCKLNLRPANCVGVIDSDYRGEIKVCLYNDSANHAYIENGTRIAQLVIVPCLLLEMEEVDELDVTERGAGGFGSTGK